MWRKIWWRLHVHRRTEQQPRDCDSARHLKRLRLRRIFHRDTGLGAKILNDHFLNMTVAFVACAKREQALSALCRSIANANQYSSGKRDAQFAGLIDHAHTHYRILVGRPLMDAALLPQPWRDALEHQAHAGVERT